MKNRRKFLHNILGFSGAIALPGTLFAKREKKVIDGSFVHMVFFWLKPETDVDAFISSTKNFITGINEVVDFHLGKPAGTPREVVDNTYSVCLVVTFNSKEDQDIYQKHPVHVKYVDDNKEKWTKVQIYDSWAGA